MKKLFVYLVVVLCCSEISAQQQFLKASASSGFGTRIRTLPAPGSGWIIFSMDNLQATRYNTCGEVLWSKKYLVQNTINSLTDLIRTGNGDYALLTRGFVNNAYVSLITLLDTAGNVRWCKSYGDPYYDHYPYTLSEDNQGNLILFGNIIHASTSPLYNMICKINSSGNVVWTKLYDHGHIWGGAIATSDNGILARTGWIFIKTDNTGNVQWTSSILAGTYNYFAPLEVGDGYIFTGYSNGSTQEINFFKMNKQGNLLWGGRKATNFYGVPPKMKRKFNGNFTGVFSQTVSGQYYPSIVEFDKDLNVVRQSAINYPSLAPKDICFPDAATSIIAGTGSGVPSCFFAKADDQYNTGCDVSLPAVTITLEPVSSMFINTNAIAYNLNVINENYIVQVMQDSAFFLCRPIKSVDIGTDTSVCSNENLTLHNRTGQLFENYLWSTGATTPSISFLQPGTYWLHAWDNCDPGFEADTIIIDVKPVVAATLGEDLIECENTTVLMRAPSCDSCNFIWSTGSTSSSIEVKDPGTYWLHIGNNNGCISTDTLTVDFAKCECDFYVPNAFTPNNNQLNEIFKPGYNCDFAEYNLKIVNRWGHIIFSSDRIESGWDGTYQNMKVPEGIYLYYISYSSLIKGKRTNKTTKSGTVAVIY